MRVDSTMKMAEFIPLKVNPFTSNKGVIFLTVKAGVMELDIKAVN